MYPSLSLVQLSVFFFARLLCGNHEDRLLLYNNGRDIMMAGFNQMPRQTGHYVTEA